jgi:hypothetical protein
MRLVACCITARTWAWVPPGRPAVKKPRQDRLGLGTQELRPGRPGPPPGRVDTAGLEDLPDGRRCDFNPEAGQLAVNPAVPPFGVRGPAAGPGH